MSYLVGICVLKREIGFDFEKAKLADTKNDVIASGY